MMHSKSYRCPNCAGKLAFDSGSDMLHCEHCGNAYTPEEAEKANQDSQGELAFRRDSESCAVRNDGHVPPDDESLDSERYFFENAPWRDADEGHLRHAECETCAASLYVDEHLVSGSCPYCGNNLVIKGLVSGDMTPDLIAPFRISREKARDNLLAHCQQGLLPAGFAKRVTLEHIVGMYVPFWLYDACIEGSATCASVERNISFSAMLMIPSVSYEVSSYTFKLNHRFSNVPADASSRLPDGYMDAIEPFDLKDMRPFKASYLVDHVAELRDVSSWKCCKRVTLRMLNSIWNSMARTFSKRDELHWLSESADLQTSWKKVKCCYFPVWVLHARWRSHDVLVAVNGQTGKVASRLPAGKVKQAALHVGSAALRFAVCALAVMALWVVGFAVIGLGMDTIANSKIDSRDSAQGVVLLWVIPFVCAIATGWIIKKARQSHRRAILKRERPLRSAHRGDDADAYLRVEGRPELISQDEKPGLAFNPMPGMKSRARADKSFGVYCGKDSFKKIRPREMVNDSEDERIFIVRTR